MTTTTPALQTENLYNEDGIAILLDRDGCIILSDEADAIEEAERFGTGPLTRVIGHRVYACPLDDAQSKIRDAYLERSGR